MILGYGSALYKAPQQSIAFASAAANPQNSSFMRTPNGSSWQGSSDLSVTVQGESRTVIQEGPPVTTLCEVEIPLKFTACFRVIL